MNSHLAPPRQLSLDQWSERYQALKQDGWEEPEYGGPLSRHFDDGDSRLARLSFDNSAASHRLWNFLLSEEERLVKAREAGHKLVGTLKDLGTVPVMAYSLPNLTAFYPDGAWWIPCVMELNAGLLAVADRMGIDDSFCPVRAMLGAFVTEAHFPLPDFLVCSAGATCDDFSTIAQRIADLGHAIHWWEIPHRRLPGPGEQAVELPGGVQAPLQQVEMVKAELERILDELGALSGCTPTESMLREGIQSANRVRSLISRIRELTFTATPCPLPALELLIAEMLAIHFCSDRDECMSVLDELLREVTGRVEAGAGYGDEETARVFWLNPVADLRAMNLLESSGARLCGTEFLFTHALDRIPTHIPPLEALARTALADPMVGSSRQRANRVERDMRQCGAEALLISRIPGASHCSIEGQIIGNIVQERLDIPVLEIEVPPLIDSIAPALQTRLEALVETVRSRRTTKTLESSRKISDKQGLW